MSDCPEPDVLGRFVDDTLPAADRLVVEQHVDGCDDCRATVSILARAATAERASAGALPTATGAAFETTQAVGERPSQRRARESPLAPGTHVGRYVIGDVLGTGGMGIVYSARDPDLDRDVAIKILRPELARVHPDATRRIVREAQAMARVAHPNVVSVFDVGTLGDQVFVAMERVTGTSLRAWLADAPRTRAQILEVFLAAGRGLVAAHDAGIVHRDFKPDNVLVGHDGRVRVTDFGLAYSEHDPDEPAIAGTPAYMSPEQHAGGNLDPRSDQFSFAVALYEALYGERPFAGATREQLAEAIARGQVRPPRGSARVPGSMRAIVVRALSATPGARYPTLDAMLRALARDRARRPRQLAIVALVALAIVGVGLGADWILRDRARAVTRTSFAAARTQLGKLLALRTEAFVAQADALYRVPAVQEVAATRDLADFGLGDEASDRARRQQIHDKLSSASWIGLARVRGGDVLAIADDKGRLLFDSVNPALWDTDLLAIPPIARAYASSTDTYIGVTKGDDPAIGPSGLFGGAARPGLYVVFARIQRIGGQPRAVFLQVVEAARLLDEVSTGDDTRLSVTALDGAAEGSVPRDVIDQVHGTGIVELTHDRHEWLAETTPLRAGDQGDAIAQIVLARTSDVGLSGLFPYARQLLALTAALLAALAAAGFAIAHRRR